MKRILLTSFLFCAAAVAAFAQQRDDDEAPPAPGERAAQSDNAREEAKDAQKNDRSSAEKRQENADRQKNAQATDKRQDKAADRQKADRQNANRPSADRQKGAQDADRFNADRPTSARPDADRGDPADGRDGAGERDRREEGRDAEGRERRRRGLGMQFEAGGQGQGLSIANIEEDSVAAQSGLRANDRILSVDGRAFNNQRQLQAYLGGQGGRRIPIVIDRGGQRYTIQLAMHDQQDGPWLGVFLQESDEGAEGAQVTAIYPAGPAARAGLRPGDVITKVNDEDVASAADLIAAIDELEPRGRAEFAVQRNNRELMLTATLGSRQSFVSRGQFDDREGQQRDGRGAEGYDDGDDFDDVPPYAMQLEHDRRMAEQHQRMERILMELRDEVKQLREAVEAKK